VLSVVDTFLGKPAIIRQSEIVISEQQRSSRQAT
jgi:hypothetical protein